MLYREFQPTRSLAPFIECFWTLEGEADLSDQTSERILPDGCVEIILNFAERFTEIGADARGRLQPRYFLAGQMTRPVLIKPNGLVQLIGIRFHPGGTVPFLPLPMHETTDQIIELGAVDGDLETELRSAAEALPSLSLKITAIERVLGKRLERLCHDSHLLGLTSSIVRFGGRVSIDTLAREAGVSGRQLRRRFLVEVGVGPKLLCRLLRFQQVFRAVDGDAPDWADVALACGYYDQAHLINDFRQFAQQTPSILLASTGHLTDAFTRKHRVTDFSNPPAANVL